VNRRRALAGVGLALLLGLVACRHGARSVARTERPAAPRRPAPTSLLRFARDGGVVRLYGADGLAPDDWRSVDKLPPVRRVLGADLDQRLVYTVDPKGTVSALDLETRRVRQLEKNVVHAALGPDGALYMADTAGVVTQLAHRVPLRFRSTLASAPRTLYATTSGTLLAFPERGAGMQVLSAEQPSGTVRLPAGPSAATFWGDLVAVAADSAVVLYDVNGKRQAPHAIRIRGHARAVLFSPSGHRIYVAEEAGRLAVLDRFSGGEVDEVKLPGPAAGLRQDIYGGWLLVRPGEGDSTWVVDPTSGRFVGTVPTRWGPDLPAVVPPATLVIRRGDDVVGLDLTKPGFPELGLVAGAANDVWMPIGWSPAPPPEAAVSDSARAAEADSAAAAGPHARIFVQVSSSRNPDWAKELAEKIKGAGLPAMVLSPNAGEDAYRVVLGPYVTREAADSAGKKVGMPSFIITVADSSAR
jgi:hypothetical protein